MATTIDRLNNEQLQERYGLTKPGWFARLRSVRTYIPDFELSQSGRSRWATAEQIQFLDNLNEAIGNGQTIAEFFERQGIVQINNQVNNPVDQLNGELAQLPSTEPIDTGSLIRSLIGSVIQSAQNQTPPEPDWLRVGRYLDEATELGVGITTSEIATLLGVAPASVAKWGRFSDFKARGFTFSCIGSFRGEKCWIVKRHLTT